MSLQTHPRKLVKSILGRDIVKTYELYGNLYIRLKPSAVLKCVSILSSNTELQFSTLADCFAVDYLQKSNSFSIYYHLISYKLQKPLFVLTDVKENESMQSLTILFQNANWYEREIFDMFGIRFDDHPDMRRILNDHTFNAFPLRKDFKT